MNKRIAKKQIKKKALSCFDRANEGDLIVLSIPIKYFNNQVSIRELYNSLKESCSKHKVGVVFIPSYCKRDMVYSNDTETTVLLINKVIEMYHNKEYNKIDDIYNQISKS